MEFMYMQVYIVYIQHTFIHAPYVALCVVRRTFETFFTTFVPLTSSRLVAVEMDSRNATSMASIVTSLGRSSVGGFWDPQEHFKAVFLMGFWSVFDVFHPSQIIPTLVKHGLFWTIVNVWHYVQWKTSHEHCWHPKNRMGRICFDGLSGSFVARRCTWFEI